MKTKKQLKHIKIKEISRKILLILYYEWINDPMYLKSCTLSFERNILTGLVVMDENDEFAEKMKLAAGEGNDSMLYVSLTYLCDKNLIDFKRSDTNTEETLYAIQPTDAGIDTVEGVENDIQSRKNFSSLFSLTINSRMTVDSLIKSEVGNIVGVGGAISSKVGIKK